MIQNNKGVVRLSNYIIVGYLKVFQWGQGKEARPCLSRGIMDVAVSCDRGLRDHQSAYMEIIVYKLKKGFPSTSGNVLRNAFKPDLSCWGWMRDANIWSYADYYEREPGSSVSSVVASGTGFLRQPGMFMSDQSGITTLPLGTPSSGIMGVFD